MRLRQTLITLGLVLLAGCMVALVVTAGPAPSLTPEQAITNGLAYLATQQGESGGIDSFGYGMDPSGSARAVLALAASGRSIESMAHVTTGNTLLDYLDEQAVAFTHQGEHTESEYLFPGQAGLLLTALTAANEDPTTFGGQDLIAQLTDTYIEATGAYSTTAAEGYTFGQASESNQGWVILGLSSAGRAVPITATRWLIEQQAENGSWADGDPDTTAQSVLALIGSGHVLPTDEVIQDALGFFRATQLPSGGWRPYWDSDPLNVDTTGWVIQGLAAAGHTSASWIAGGSSDPRQAILSLAKGDGRIGGTYANAWSTTDAICGLSEQPLYFLSNALRAQRGLNWLARQQNGDGSWSGFSGQNVGATCDAILAFAAGGYDPASVATEGSGLSGLDYLADHGPAYANEGPDKAGKLALAIVAAGGDPTDLDGADILQILRDNWYDAEMGAFGTVTNTYHQAFPMLAYAAAGEAIPVSVTQTLIGLQQEDGGWKYDLDPTPQNTTGPDHTGLALQALIAAGLPSDDPVVQSGIAYLAALQGDDAGWSGATPTAFALQGLLATGQDVNAGQWLKGGLSPSRHLASFQKLDGPLVSSWDSPHDDLLATQQGLQALLGLTYPHTPGELLPFMRGAAPPDPDRMVVGDPQPIAYAPMTIALPYGSDLDRNGSAGFAYRELGAGEWITSTQPVRTRGYYEVSVPDIERGAWEIRATYEDPDGVQYGGEIVERLVLTDTLSLYRGFLPLMVKP